MSASKKPEPIDLRTPLIAVATWAGAWCGVTGGPGWAAGLAIVLGLGGAAWRWRNRALVAAMACTLLGGVIGGLSCWTVRASPMTSLAQERATVRIEAQVTGDPVFHPARGFLASQTVVAVRVRQATARGQSFKLRQAASLAITGDAPTLAVGQQILVDTRASWRDNSLTPQVWLSTISPLVIEAPPNWWDTQLNRARIGLRDAMRWSPPDQAGLVPGVVVGDVSGVSPEIVEAFRATSLTHLTAVSGTNLTLMVVFLVSVAKLARLRGWWLRGVTVVGIVLFVALCRTEPSVLRAAAMGIVGLVATGVSTTPGRGLRHWGAAVAAVCLLQPAMSHSWGFAMSAAATAGILWWSPRWAASMRQWAPAWLADLVAVPLAAQLATQPFITVLSGQISIVGLFANMVAAPFVGPVTVVGLVACVQSMIWPASAAVLGWVAGWCCQPIILAATTLGALPRPLISWGAAQWGSAAVALISLVGVSWLISRVLPGVLSRWWSSTLAFVLLGAVAILPVPSIGWPGPWTVAFCDVGQGDASVLRISPRVGVLVDAGGDPQLLRRCLGSLGVDHLALVIFSHEHSDHVDGASGLARYVAVDQVLVRDGLSAAAMQGVANFMGDAQLPVAPTKAGQVVVVGPLRWQTVSSGPVWQSSASDGEGEDAGENNAGVIGLAQLGDLRILFTGDAEPEEQQMALRHRGEIRADVVKVPHHGSARQDTGFLAATGAAVAVVSVGAGNSYGHPATATIDHLLADGMTVYRTDQCGGVAISLTATGLSVRTQT